MNGIVVFGLVLAIFVSFIASLWYLFKTLRVMWRFHFFIAITAIFLSPLIHIIFYFFPKDGFDDYTRGLFKKYFFSLAAIFVSGFIASIVIPSLESRKITDTMSGEADNREPWEWIIRSERLE